MPTTRRAAALPALALAGVLLATPHAMPAVAQIAEWRLVATIPGFPVATAHAPGHTRRIFVATITGVIYVIEDGTLLPEPFLDVTGTTIASQESGLLGLAFHPDFQSNGLFYIYHTTPNATIAEYRVLGDPATSNTAHPASRRVVLTVANGPPPSYTHVAGWIGFGPDTYLYGAIGDHQNGAAPQQPGSLLGKILRIDVDTRDPGLEYAIPPNNPFAGLGDPGRDEVWAWGLRNPWRCSFDSELGTLWIGDVGQSAWEEVNRQPASSPGGENYGWPCFEGPAGQPCTPPPPILTPPVHYYPPTPGINNYVVGGHVYRGQLIPRLAGEYLYFRARQTWRLDAGATPALGASIPASMLTTLGGLSMSQDDDAELFMCSVFEGNAVYTLVATPCSPADLTSGSDPNARGYAQPNGVLDHHDFLYYFQELAGGNLAACDLSSTALPNTPGFGTPDGALSNDDFFYYLLLFSAGC